MVVLNGIEGFFIFLGKLTITCLTTIFGLALIQRDVTIQVSFYAVPVVLILIFSWIITGIFFNLFAVAIDTIFLCFAEDGERHDGSAEKPYFMSNDLLKYVDHKKVEMSQTKRT